MEGRRYTSDAIRQGVTSDFALEVGAPQIVGGAPGQRRRASHEVEDVEADRRSLGCDRQRPIVTQNAARLGYLPLERLCS